MKQGKTIKELAEEIQRRTEAKRDYRVDTREMAMFQPEHATDEKPGAVKIAVGEKGSFPATDWGHRQIGTHTQIPAKYYDRMKKEAPDLLTRNVNHWFQEEPDRRLVRTLDGSLRAFLSNRYRILDNDQVLEGVLPVLAERQDLKIVSSQVTEKKLYIKATFSRMTMEVARGDAVQAGLVISNSEDGRGSVRVEPLLYRLICLNGMVVADKAMRKYHIGREAGDEGGGAFEVFKDDTVKADDYAFQLKMRDVVRASLNEASFQDSVIKLGNTKRNQITGSPIKAIEEVQNQFSLSDIEKDSVITHLLRGEDLNQFGVINAVTRTSIDVSSYDRASELEQVGGQIMDLDPKDWKVISEAV